MKFTSTAFIPSRLRRPISGYINWAFVWDPVSHVASGWFLQSKPLCYPCPLAHPFTGKYSLFSRYNSFYLPLLIFFLKDLLLFLLRKKKFFYTYIYICIEYIFYKNSLYYYINNLKCYLLLFKIIII